MHDDAPAPEPAATAPAQTTDHAATATAASPAAAADGSTPSASVDDWTLEAPKDLAGATPDDAKSMEAFAKAEGLSKTQAEALLEREISGRTSRNAAAMAHADQVANTFAQQVEKHAEFGGAKLPQTLAAANRALRAFTTLEERKTILALPHANHPVLIALLARAAAALPAEDAPPADAGQRGIGFASAAHTVYGGKLSRG